MIARWGHLHNSVSRGNAIYLGSVRKFSSHDMFIIKITKTYSEAQNTISTYSRSFKSVSYVQIGEM